jgi:hypothetical protein
LEGVLLGGAGSTGSSLLRTLLNRHPEIFSGEELSFFNKEQLFEDWVGFRPRIVSRVRRPLATRGWFPYPGHGLLHGDYAWRADELRELVLTSPSIESFAPAFFEKALARSGKTVWAEKTPSNAYSFRAFLRAFPSGKVVHTVRNPLDATASYVRSTGRHPYFASALWLYNSASALSVSGNPRYCAIKYEDLVSRPQQTLDALFAFLGIPLNQDLTQPSVGDTAVHTRNPGWRSDRTGPVQAPEQPAFESVDPTVQRQIVESLSALAISERHVRSKGLGHRTCVEVCQALGYDFTPVRPNDRRPLVREYIRDIVSRTILRYPTGGRFYPVTIEREG